MKLNNFTKEELLEIINKSKSLIELTNSIGFHGCVNSRIKKEIIDYYNNLGYDVLQELKDNLAKSKIKTYICKQCGKQFTEKYSKYSSGDFCCRKCASKYSHSFIDTEKISKKMKKLFHNGLIKIPSKNSQTFQEYYKNPKICPICGNIIPYNKKSRKTCSTACGIKLASKNNPHINDGGYRKGSSRGKHGYYKGIWCDSTYELAYLIYCLDHNIDIKRCNESFEYELNGKKHTYHPDFIVDGNIIEIKNYYREENDIKLNAISKEKKILYYEDLIPCFEYVSKTYNKKYRKRWNNFYELYE